MLFCGHVLLVVLTEKKLLECFTKRIAKKNQREFRVVKVIKRKGDKLYVKWKGYNNTFNSSIDKKDIIVPVTVDLSKLSDVVKTGVVRKDVNNAKMKTLKIKYMILVT